MLRVLFGGVPLLGSLGTFSMFMYGIFLTVNDEKASFAISYRSDDKMPGL